HPVYTNWLVTCPSFSPEHDEAIYKVATVPGPTMDNELCRDLFTHVVAASEILGVDNDFRDRMKYLLSQLPPDQIGQGGQLQEWLEDVDASIDTAHRHCSHLVGLYPGDQISLYYTPELAAAAKHSVDLRRDANSALTPWSCAWRMNLRTRLQEGDAAWKNLLFLYGYNKTATNLIFADNNRQLDAIFGRLAGIANFFVQCPREEIILLPALPTALAHGRVSGLRASGAFVINDLTWTNGQFTGATLISQAGHPGKIRSRWPLRILEDGNPLAIVPTIPTLYQFPTRAGATYRLEPMK
ncbi:MAG TPA: glycoside hydrolase family 95 protein, partial [Verrucomicrobiae bacterium]